MISIRIDLYFLAKPIEIEPAEGEIVISVPPSYDLPTQRQKTALEYYENQRKDSASRQKEAIEKYPDEWEKLKRKPDEADDAVNPIILGKGKNSGKVCINLAFNLADYKLHLNVFSLKMLTLKMI